MSGKNDPKSCKCELYYTALKNASNKIAAQTTTISELEKQIFLLNLQIYDMAALNLRLTEEINANKCKIKCRKYIQLLAFL